MSGLFENLNRRGVIRIAVAYLAVSWLILQVIDVVGGIFELPAWLPPFAFFALLVGFPIAVILTWVYDITPQGIVATDDTEPSTPPARFGGRKIDFIIISSLALVIALLGGRLLIGPDQSVLQQGPPLVSDYRQLTRSQIFFPPTQSPYPIVSDGSRLYFNDWNNYELGLQTLPHAGGNAQRMESPFDEGTLINPATMAPNWTDLVVGAFNPKEGEPPDVWRIPVMGGDPRRVGQGTDVSYSSDGTNIVLLRGMDELTIATPDLTESRKLAKLRGRLHWPRFSPDDSAIRYTLHRDIRSIWEISVDGGEPQRLFPEWESVDHCCGSWTKDGRYYVFQATVDYRTQIWALRADAGAPVIENAKPITTGAIDFRRPTLSKDDERIFSVGWQLRGELVKFDPELERFIPLQGFESVSAEWLAISPDEELAAYVSFQEAALWRSGTDGSRKLQLTFPPMRAVDPVWSPDQRHIAFMAQVPGEPWRIYLVSPDGGAPAPVGEQARPQWWPAWSPDGQQMTFNEAGSETVKILNVATGNISDLPGSEGLSRTLWAPDGKSIIARYQNKFVVFDIETHESRVVAEHIPYDRFEISRDGRYLYIVNPYMLGSQASVLRITIADGTEERILRLSDVRIPWGVRGMWVGLAPDGNPIVLRDLSIHHIYELDWLSSESAN